MNEIIVSSIIFTVSFVYYILSFSMDEAISSYPRVLIMLMMIMSGYLMGSNIYKHIKKKEKPVWVFPEKWQNIVIGAIAFILYILTLNILGFIIATSVFYLTWMMLIRKSTLFINILITAGLVLTLYLLFGVLLNVPLPEGVLF